MAVAHSVQRGLPLQNLPVQNGSEQNGSEQKVQQAAPSLLDRAKRSVSWTWTVARAVASEVAGKVAFVAFRVLSWIHPSIWPHLEIAYLRVRRIVDSVRNSWKEQKIQAEMDSLKAENKELKAQVLEQAPKVAEHGELSRANKVLKAETNENGFLKGQIEGLKKRNEALTLECKTVEEGKNAALASLAQKQDLEEQNTALVRQMSGLSYFLLMAASFNQQLQQQLALQEKTAPCLDEHMGNMAAIRKVLSQLPSPAPSVNRHESDDNMRTVLPLLAQQMKIAHQLLQAAKKQLQEGGTGMAFQAVLGRFERIVNDTMPLLGVNVEV